MCFLISRLSELKGYFHYFPPFVIRIDRNTRLAIRLMLETIDVIHLTVLYCIDGAAIFANVLLIYIITTRLSYYVLPLLSHSERRKKCDHIQYFCWIMRLLILEMHFQVPLLSNGTHYCPIRSFYFFFSYRRVVCLPDFRVLFIYLGQCSTISKFFCHFCESK